MSVNVSRRGDSIVVESAMSEFKIMDKFYPSSKYSVSGFAISTPYLHLWCGNFGINGVLAIPTKSFENNDYKEAINVINEFTKWLEDKQHLRYNLIDKVEERINVIKNILKKDRGAVGTAPVFSTYPIPASWVLLMGGKIEDKVGLGGVIVCKNIFNRFGAKAFITFPVSGLRSTGYVKVVGDPNTVKTMVKDLADEASNIRVFSD